MPKESNRRPMSRGNSRSLIHQLSSQSILVPFTNRATLDEIIEPLTNRQTEHRQQINFRRMYRYGLALVLIGVLCNWIGFTQTYFSPVRYLGIGCILVGLIFICVSLAKWMIDREMHSEDSACEEAPPSVHVIVPVDGSNWQSNEAVSKPPDYEMVVGNWLPSYDEAIRVSPVALLQIAPSATPVHLPAADLEADRPRPERRTHLFWRLCTRTN